MDTIILAVAITGIITFGLGLVAGMSWQWQRSEAYIKRLEAKVVELQVTMWGQLFEANDMPPPKQGKPMITVDIDDYSDKDDWDEQDNFDMDEQLMQTGSHQ